MRSVESDAAILAMARRQHGVVARWQLIAAGVPASVIAGRVARRSLDPVALRVYRVPGLEGPRRGLVAAVLGCGPYAVGSHETAGELHRVHGHRLSRIAVSVWRGHPQPRENIVVHRVRFASDERMLCDGVPVTTPARTILDLAATLANRDLEQAVARCLRLTDLTSDDLLKLAARYPRRPGTPRLRALLGADMPLGMTRSEAEERFLALVRRAQLPAPHTNIRVHGFEADFYWPAHAVVVEIDGHTYHASRDAQQRDRTRDSSFAAAGIRVLRFTWQDLTRRSESTLAKVALALGHARV